MWCQIKLSPHPRPLLLKCIHPRALLYTLQKFNGETEAKHERGIMKNEMPSQKWRKLDKKMKCPPCS